ncbi:MAG: PP2C family protein-serine/threonine phosphatase [Planctomycetaceae bacterium]
MRWEQSIQYASRSDIGFRRANNQDSIAVQICQDEATFAEHGHLFLVADGMGGHAVGELASKIAADTIPHTYFKMRGEAPPAALKHALEVANRNINERGSLNREFERMGTTCSALVLSPRGAVIAHVGDSRVYRIRGGRINQLTFDHSLQWELLRAGRTKPDEMFLVEPRHVITRSLGPDETVKVDTEGPYAVLPGDTYLLCSDGLTNHVNDQEIGMIAGELPPGEASRLLVDLANLRGRW